MLCKSEHDLVPVNLGGSYFGHASRLVQNCIDANLDLTVNSDSVNNLYDDNISLISYLIC